MSEQNPTSVDMLALGQRAKSAARMLRRFSTQQKNEALHAIADALAANAASILEANRADLLAGEAAGMSAALLDRLNLQERLPGVIADVRKVASLPDPVGEEYDQQHLENGLRIKKRRVPIGVLGVIYESRPNVTVDISALAFKTSNAVILRGGSETLHSNIALVDCIQTALERVGFPPDAVQLIRARDRHYVSELLKLHQYVDMIIPRGGANLHQFCRENSTIPVITGGIGICHLYVEASADLDAALEVIHNAKTQRPSVCNALDTLLVQRELVPQLLPRLIERLHPDGVTLKLAPELHHFLNSNPQVQAAQDEDWDVEWLDLILGVKPVASIDEAIDHIERHGTAHSDGILTGDSQAAQHFLNEVDSAAVYVNASTRFTDGSALGLGAEVAVSTQKLHARGPMALEALTTYKWIIEGDWHTRP